MRILVSFFYSLLCAFVIAANAASDAALAQQVKNPKQSGTANTGDLSLQQIQARREVLFRQMLNRPDDLDTAFEYAALSVRAGDLEAAVSTLERMLIFAPGLPRLQLELGLLYYRLGAHDTASTYLEAAISGSNVPEPVLARVQNLLAEIANAQDRDVLSAEVRAGIRFQTNANRAPETRGILLNGLPFLLNPNAVGQEDTNVYVGGSLHYAMDLESQGDTFEIDVLGYGSKQFERNELDLLQSEITFGPAFDLGRFEIDNAKLGLYGIVSGVVLGGEFYNGAFGAGSRLAAQPNPKTSVLFKTEYRRRIYNNTSDAPRATDRNGHEFRAGLYGSRVVNPNLLMNFGLQGQRTLAERDYLQYSEVSVWAGPTIAFRSPVADSNKIWTASLTAGGTFRNYDSPDPIINLNNAQHDNEFFGKASLSIPVNNGWSVLSETEYRAVDSNYSTREHDNFSVTLSIVKKW